MTNGIIQRLSAGLPDPQRVIGDDATGPQKAPAEVLPAAAPSSAGRLTTAGARIGR